MVPVTKPVAHEPPTPAETTLMVLETWLTTQASLSVRGLTETGPSPTGISASNWGLPGRLESRPATGDCLAGLHRTQTATNLPCSPQIEVFHPPRAGSDWFAKVRNLQVPARPTAPWSPSASLSERVLR